MSFGMRVLGLSLSSLFFFSVPALAQAPLPQQPAKPPPTKGAIKALLNEAGLVEKLDICAGLYRNPDTVKLTIIIEKNGMLHLVGAEPELDQDLYACIYDAIAAQSFGKHDARLKVVTSVKLPNSAMTEGLEQTWKTAGGVSIAGLSLMGLGVALFVTGISIAWADPDRYSDKVSLGYTIAASSLVPIMPGAVMALSGLMTRAGLLRSRGVGISGLGTFGGWAFWGAGFPITVMAVVMMFIENTAMAGDCMEEGCGDDSDNAMVGPLVMLTVGGCLFVGSIASQAAQLRYLEKKKKAGLAALPAVVPFVTMSAGPRGAAPVAGLAGIF